MSSMRRKAVPVLLTCSSPEQDHLHSGLRGPVQGENVGCLLKTREKIAANGTNM